MSRFAAIQVIIFLWVGTCGARGQEPNHGSSSLPDAPSATLSRMLLDEGRSAQAASGIDSRLVHGSETSVGLETAHADLSDLIKLAPIEKDSPDVAVEKYLHATFLARNPGYHPWMNGSFIDRATHAASSFFIREDESGRRRLNTSYFVGMLSSAFVHTAYRPYWRRSASDPFSNFGSNIGSDAGMNFLHEFAPGIGQLMKSHAPRFVYRIERHISR